MVDKLKIGLIVRPRGLKGELKVQPMTDDITRFKKLKDVLIDDIPFKVTATAINGNVVFLSLMGINDIDNAEKLRGKFISVTRENAVLLPEGRYFIADIVGSVVKTDCDEVVGTVREITEARTDIFTVDTADNKVVRFPFLKDLVKTVDIERQIIVVNKKRLEEVAVYED